MKETTEPARITCFKAMEGLPRSADRYLDGPDAGDFFATRLWYDVLLRHAMPSDARPLVVTGRAGAEDGLALVLMKYRGAFRSLTGPYSLAWRPLHASGASADAIALAGRSIGRRLRFRQPTVLELLDAGLDGLAPFIQGLRRAGLRVLPFDHVGNWHEVLPPDVTWSAYLAERDAALRNTVRRKVARAARTHGFDFVSAPGPALDAAIVAYEAVRAASWKPEEPFPSFDAALLRAAAAAGVARIGVLRTHDGGPVAAQYWMLDRPGGGGSPQRATVLKLSYVERARADSPGTVLTALMIRELLEKDGVRILDFGRGDDPYKQQWVRQRRQRIGLVIADPLHPAGLAAIARQKLGGWVRGMRRRG